MFVHCIFTITGRTHFRTWSDDFSNIYVCQLRGQCCSLNPKSPQLRYRWWAVRDSNTFYHYYIDRFVYVHIGKCFGVICTTYNFSKLPTYMLVDLTLMKSHFSRTWLPFFDRNDVCVFPIDRDSPTSFDWIVWFLSIFLAYESYYSYFCFIAYCFFVN